MPELKQGDRVVAWNKPPRDQKIVCTFYALSSTGKKYVCLTQSRTGAAMHKLFAFCKPYKEKGNE